MPLPVKRGEEAPPRREPASPKERHVLDVLSSSLLAKSKAGLPAKIAEGLRTTGAVSSVPARVRAGAQLELYNVKQQLLSNVGLKLDKHEGILYHYSQLESSGWKVCDETLDCLVMTNRRFVEVQNHRISSLVDLKSVVSIEHLQNEAGWDKVVAGLFDHTEKAFMVSSRRIAAFFCRELKALTAKEYEREVKERDAPPDDAPDFLAFGRSMLAMMALADDMRVGVPNCPSLTLMTRTKKFVSYPRTFLAKDAVEWIVRYCKLKNIMIALESPTENKRRVTVTEARQNWKKAAVHIAVTPEHAKELLGQMLSSNVISCAYAKKTQLEMKDDFYRFADERDSKSSKQLILNEPSKRGPSPSIQSSKSSMIDLPKSAGDAVALSVSLLSNMLDALCSVAVVQQAEYVIKHEMCTAIKKSDAYRTSCEASASLAGLRDESLVAMSDRQKFCFFFNVYNMLTLHASIELPLDKKAAAEGLFGDSGLSKTACYLVGRCPYSLFDIEFKVLRPQVQSLPVGRFLGGVAAAVTSKRENKVLVNPCNGWTAAMNFALGRAEPPGARIRVFPDPADLELTLNECTRDFLFRHLKIGFKPVKAGAGGSATMKMKAYVPTLLKPHSHEFGTSSLEIVNWLIQFCPLSLQIHILNNCDVSKAKVMFLPPVSSFYIDLSHIKGRGKPFGKPISGALNNPAHEEIWHPAEQDNLESEWLRDITSLQALRQVVTAGKMSKNPVGKVLGTYVQRFRTTYEKEFVESDAHPGLQELIEMLCGFHALVCRSKDIKRDAHEPLAANMPIAAALKVLFPQQSDLTELSSTLESNNITEVGRLRSMNETDWKALQLPVAVKNVLGMIREEEADMTELNALKVIGDGLFSGTFPTVFQWYKQKLEAEEEAIRCARKEYRELVTLRALGLDEFFWLTEDEYLECGRSNPALLPFAEAIRATNQLDAVVKSNSLPSAIDKMVDITNMISGAVSQFWEQVAQEAETPRAEGEKQRRTAPKKRRNLSADDLVLILSYVFIQAEMENLPALSSVVSDFMEATQSMPRNALPSARMHYEDQYLGHAGFVQTTIQLALRFMTGKLRDTLEPAKDTQSFSSCASVSPDDKRSEMKDDKRSETKDDPDKRPKDPEERANPASLDKSPAADLSRAVSGDASDQRSTAIESAPKRVVSGTTSVDTDRPSSTGPLDSSDKLATLPKRAIDPPTVASPDKGSVPSSLPGTSPIEGKRSVAGTDLATDKRSIPVSPCNGPLDSTKRVIPGAALDSAQLPKRAGQEPDRARDSLQPSDTPTSVTSQPLDRSQTLERSREDTGRPRH